MIASFRLIVLHSGFLFALKKIFVDIPEFSRQICSYEVGYILHFGDFLIGFVEQ